MSRGPIKVAESCRYGIRWITLEAVIGRTDASDLADGRCAVAAVAKNGLYTDAINKNEVIHPARRWTPQGRFRDASRRVVRLNGKEAQPRSVLRLKQTARLAPTHTG